MMSRNEMTVEKAEKIAYAMNHRFGFYLDAISVEEVMNLKPISTAKKGGMGYEVYAIQYGSVTFLCLVYSDGNVCSQFSFW